MALQVELNGALAAVEDITAALTTNYGHFTLMQANDGAVRGLDLHLDRLQAATRALFGSALERDIVRNYLRRLSADHAAMTLRATVFARGFDRARPEASTPADVLVFASAPAVPPSTPPRVKSVRYARDAAALKHVATFPLFHHRRSARLAGFDDALFVNAEGEISEGSVWNIVFFDGARVVAPSAPSLPGVTLALLERGVMAHGLAFERRAVKLGDLAAFPAAFALNASIGVQPIAAIDGHVFANDSGLTRRLIQCYEGNPWEPI